VTSGMVLVTAFYLWVALSISTTLPYPTVAAQMVVLGLGIGPTSAPATESIMGAVTARQAGIGSAVNDTTRLLGGTLGVAIIGRVALSVYSARLTDSLAFFDGWLDWAGIEEHTSVVFRPILVVANAESGRRAAHDEARRLGQTF